METGNRRRLALLVTPVALGLLMAAGLAWQAHAAERAHRAAMEGVVRDHADFAAFLLMRVAREQLELRALYGFGAVLRRSPGADLPAATELATDRTERRRCPLPGTDSSRLQVRLRLDDGELTTAGGPVAEGTRRWLADTLRALATAAPAGGGVRHAFRERGEPGMIAYLVARDGEGGAQAVYALNGCLALGDGTTVFDAALRDASALPPSLTGGLPNDSLLSVEVRDPAGRIAYASPTRWTSPYRGEAGSAALGGAVLRVTLRPDAAEQLVVGGLPASRLPLALALLALATLLATAAVVQAHRQLELVRLRERFMRNASHELRTPLQQILLFADLLRMGKLASSAERERALDVVGTETRRLIHLVDGVLRFTREGVPDEGRPAPSAIRLAEVVRETVEAFRPLAAARDAKLVLEADADVSAIASPESVRQVTLNLVDNAVKYGPAGQTVRIRVDRDEGNARLSVDDEGPGVPAAERERVFAPFHRLAREERGGTPGTGIGLAIVRDLVEREGGTVAVAEAPGGARFTVCWPVARGGARR